MSPDQPTRVEREDGGVELQYPNGARVILMPGFAWAQGAEGALEQMLLQILRERWQAPPEELAQRQAAFRETYQQAKALLMRPARLDYSGKTENENRHGASSPGERTSRRKARNKRHGCGRSGLGPS